MSEQLTIDTAATAVVYYNATEAGLAELKVKYGDIALFNVNHKDGMAFAKKARSEMVSLRTALEKKRKELKKPLLDYGRLVDSEAARITARIEEIERPVDQLITDAEQRAEKERQAAIEAERARMEHIQKRIAEIDSYPLRAVGKSAAHAQQTIDALLDCKVTQELFQEFFDVARAKHFAAMETLVEILDGAEAIEAARADRAQLEQQRAALEAERAAISATQPVAPVASAPPQSSVGTIQQVSKHVANERAATPVATGELRKLAPKRMICSRPSDEEIIGVLAMNYHVHESEVLKWLMDMDFAAVGNELLKEFA